MIWVGHFVWKLPGHINQFLDSKDATERGAQIFCWLVTLVLLFLWGRFFIRMFSPMVRAIREMVG